jgi:hypothetical protein
MQPEGWKAAKTRDGGNVLERTVMTAAEVYAGSDGDVTKRYYEELCERGVIGFVAMNLFRAQKCSVRAKKYTRRYKGNAYDRKNWSMGNLARTLVLNGAALGICFGWKEDPGQAYHNWVLYIDLPTGQASFHAAERGEGPEYTGDWDGLHLSAERILAFCDSVMALPVGITEPMPVDAPVVTAPAAPQPLRFGDPHSIALVRQRRRA